MDRLQQLSFQQVQSLDPRPSSVLEVGCGDGAFLLRLATLLPQADIVGVDVSESALGKASRMLGDRPNVRLVRAAAEELPFASDAFDALVANKSFHHWDDWEAGLEEANRVLRAHGMLIIADALAAGVIGRPWVRRVAEFIDGGRILDEARFDAMLDAAGFAILRRIPDPSSAGMLFVTVATPSDRRIERRRTVESTEGA